LTKKLKKVKGGGGYESADNAQHLGANMGFSKILGATAPQASPVAPSLMKEIAIRLNGN